ncbi:MAG: hypothetical protein KatS3mg082_0862 [Nitrospiraceae bacterium]|nr:MAG: hypothetical protein KatS3mg082_0862 [Nitrospiraceae bacterium]
MTFYHVEIVVEKESNDESYSAYSPTLPGCFSNGKTIEEARRNIREVDPAAHCFPPRPRPADPTE